MSISQITNVGLRTMLTSTLQQQEAQLTTLTGQLSSQKLHADLTDYDPSAARNILSIQNTATQKQAYINVINTVSTKLSVYDTTMTDLESIVSQAQALANQNPGFSASTAPNIAIQATNYLKSVGVDLNQQLNGQYIYAGARYSTQPTSDLSVLPTSTLSPTIYTDNLTLPSYDSDYTAAPTTVTLLASDTQAWFTGTVAPPERVSLTTGGTTYTYDVQAGDTGATIAQAMAAEIGNTTYVSGSNWFSMNNGATFSAGTVNVTSAAAYATESATVDVGNVLNYGVSSDNPAIQQMVAGLRYLQKAGNDTDSATYQSDIQQASSLLTSALTSVQNLHTSVAYNINTLATEKKTQQAGISNLTDQLSDIQAVDITQVSAQITSLETILQASYMVTGSLEKLSIVSYL